MKYVFLISVLLVGTLGAWAEDNTMMKSDDSTAKSGDAMMKANDSMAPSDADKKMSMDPMDQTAYNLKGLGKQVMAFTNEKDAMMLAKNQTVVYFFAATWCPDCQATYKDIKKNAAMLPMGVTLVFVNYDKASELKKKYGVTSQHTFVVIGPNGEKKKVWNGASTVADIVKNAKMM